MRNAICFLICLNLGGQALWAADSGAQDSHRPSATKTAPAPKAAPSTTQQARINSLIKRMNAKDDDFSARIELSQIYFDQKDYDQVITYLKPARDQLPRRGLLFLAKSELAQKDYLNEIRTLTRMVTVSPDDYMGEEMLARAYLADNKLSDAITHFRASIKINPRYKGSYEGLLKMYEDEKNSDDKRNLLEDMEKVFGNAPDVVDQLCAEYSSAGYIDRAISVCELAVQADPLSPENHLLLGLNHKYLHENDDARKILYRAAKEFPKYARAQCVAGDLATDLGDVKAAARFYKQGTQADPKALDCQVGLAKSAFTLKDYDTSIDAYKSACQINRKYSLDMRISAKQLRRQGQSDTADRYTSAAGYCDN